MFHGFEISHIFQDHRDEATGLSFSCQFARDEKCIGNKIHACAIKHVNDSIQLIEFFNEFTDIEYEDEDQIIEETKEVRKFSYHKYKKTGLFRSLCSRPSVIEGGTGRNPPITLCRGWHPPVLEFVVFL